MATDLEIELLDSPISLVKDFDKWTASIKTKIGKRILENLSANTDGLDRYIECAEIQELPGAFICCSFYQRDINDALTRAGIFMGAGKGMPAATLTRHDSFPLINYKKLVAGHNLPGPVIAQFFGGAEVTAEIALKASPSELTFFHQFLNSPRIKALKNKFYVIGFAIQSMKDQKSVVSHEIFHAYNFLNSQYAKTVSSFWKNTVSTEDQALITSELGRAYNVEDQSLAIDEFQAYLLQSRPETDRMKLFVSKYRNLLLEELARNQIALIKF